MCCTDVSCWYLQVFLGPQSMNKNRSCFFVHGHLQKSAAKVLQNTDIYKRCTQKDQKGLCAIEEKAVLLYEKTIEDYYERIIIFLETRCGYQRCENENCP